MRLWLLRHTHALRAREDGEAADARRPLSAKGRAAAKELGRFFRRNGALATVRTCWHSPLVRARGTAEIFHRAADLPARLVCVAGAAPEDDPRVMARRLDRWRGGDLILVGHEPHLSALAALLVSGRGQPGPFELKKGAVLALERVPGRARDGRPRWLVRWLLAPELVG